MTSVDISAACCQQSTSIECHPKPSIGSELARRFLHDEPLSIIYQKHHNQLPGLIQYHILTHPDLLE
jgi:hypothetical protein